MRLLTKQAARCGIEYRRFRFELQAGGNMRQDIEASIIELSLFRVLQQRVCPVYQGRSFSVATEVRMIAGLLHQSPVARTYGACRRVTIDAEDLVEVLILFVRAAQSDSLPRLDVYTHP